MKQITKLIALVGYIGIAVLTYFLWGFYPDLQRLVVVVFLAGAINLSGFLYVIEWIKKNDDKWDKFKKEDFHDMGKSLDQLWTYCRKHIEEDKKK